ncbi:MAG: peptidoglycan DD-metalloendopeptidase family protein [Chloroflexota bacterium]
MAQQALKLKVIGIPHIPSITLINARPDAGTNGEVAFKVPVGETDVTVIDVKEDIEKKHHEGKVYQWFQAQFADGVAWVRDDLIEIWGDGSTAGYGVIQTPTKAFSLTRQAVAVPQGAEIVTPAPVVSTPTVGVTEPIAPVVDNTPETEVAPVEIAPIPATARAMTNYPAKIRSGAGTRNAQLASMTLGETAQVMDEPAQLDQGGNGLYWVKVNYQGQVGWTREDLVRLSGNFTPFGLNAPDKYPSPAQASTWIRGWDTAGSIWNTGRHVGWDHAGQRGAPLLAGPQGGVVYARVDCAKCGSQGRSTVEAGMSLYDSRIYTDQGWNFGYGHYVIVGYENSKLPASTRTYLEAEGLGGQHIFVMYAHCQDLVVQTGDMLAPNQQIATLGNSGMSSGAHLHLEVRISPTMSPSRWSALNNGLRSPGILFLR